MKSQAEPTEEEMADLVERLNSYTPDGYRARELRFCHAPKGTLPVKERGLDDFYSWVINVWILRQPDSLTLMRLFIDLNFNLTAFAAAVTGQFADYALAKSRVR